MSIEATATPETGVETPETPVEETVIETPAEAVIPAEPVAPVPAPEPVIEERVYTYQPTDDAGRPLGGKQVIKYSTPEELADKLRDQNVLLVRQLRDKTRKLRLGIAEQEEIPAEAPRLSGLVEFRAKALSNDERVKLSRDLLDPELFDEATDALFEAKLGVRPDVLRTTLESIASDTVALKASRESEAFMAANRDYVRCPENSDAIVNWMQRYNLAPVQDNFQKAFNALKSAGVLVEVESAPVEPVAPAPVVQPVVETVVEVPVVETPPPPPPAEPVHQPRIATGFTREQAAADVPTPRAPGDDIVFEQVVNGQKRTFRGAQAIDRMPSDEYARRLKFERGFAAKVEKLYNQPRR